MIKRKKRKSNRKEYKAEDEQNYFVRTHVHTKHLHVHICVCTYLLYIYQLFVSYFNTCTRIHTTRYTWLHLHVMCTQTLHVQIFLAMFDTNLLFIKKTFKNMIIAKQFMYCSIVNHFYLNTCSRIHTTYTHDYTYT
jgi:hypothetical protein